MTVRFHSFPQPLRSITCSPLTSTFSNRENASSEMPVHSRMTEGYPSAPFSNRRAVAVTVIAVSFFTTAQGQARRSLAQARLEKENLLKYSAQRFLLRWHQGPGCLRWPRIMRQHHQMLENAVGYAWKIFLRLGSGLAC